MSLRYVRLLSGLVLGLIALGCADGKPPAGAPMAKPYPVHGRVVFADKSPLRGGVIYFEPVHVKTGSKVRYQGSSLVDAKGEFTVGFNSDGRGVAPGDYKVSVLPREINELKNSNSSRIPKTYREAGTTPLKVTIKEEENVMDIVLK